LAKIYYILVTASYKDEKSMEDSILFAKRVLVSKDNLKNYTSNNFTVLKTMNNELLIEQKFSLKVTTFRKISESLFLSKNIVA
jgi:hypothetical protein